MPAGGRKILAVLYVLLRKQKKKPRFLVVKDAEEGDWTFISGTCEEREPADKCAIREIREETRGLVSLRKLPARTRRFHTFYNESRVEVMFIPLRLTEEMMGMIASEFPRIETHGRPELEENTELRFETLGQFMRRKNIWGFVRDVCGMDSFVENCPK